MTEEETKACTILRCLVGSQAYGIGGADSDRDEKGVCIEPLDAAFTLSGGFEQFEHRDAAIRTGKKDAPSEPGDLDLTVYSLRKYLRLAAYGNPNVVELLFIRDKSSVVLSDARGLQLQEMYPFIISRESGRRYLGYMEAQKQRLLGERGQKMVTRTDLVEDHGYDTKYASHLLRLGFQGVELQETGKLEMPSPEKYRAIVKSVKDGKVSLNDVLQMAGDLELKLKDLIKDGPLRSTPDIIHLTEWMQQVYFENWRANQKYTYFHATRKSLSGDEPDVIH